MTRIKDCVTRMALVNNSVAITVQDSGEHVLAIVPNLKGARSRVPTQPKRYLQDRF